ncbi:MAG: beta-ketoacyl synthase chain length factor [Cellvibrionaceae bacterium]
MEVSVSDGTNKGATASISVKRWAAWAPGVHSVEEWEDWALGGFEYQVGEETAPDVKAIPAMLRRRLSPLGKMALSVAWPLVGDSQSLPSVFCSRHGELERTVGMLKSLAEGESLSPTHFSLSVHNAIGGVYSIARKDPSAITALAIGDEGFSQALVEAALILEEGQHQEVLCVIYDAPIPEIYSDASLIKVEPSKPYAAAFVLGQNSNKGENDFTVSLVKQSISANEPLAVPDALEFIRFLLKDDDKTLLLSGKRHSWQWDKL